MKKKLPIIIFISTLVLLGISGIAHAEMKYTLLESFPGFFTAGTTGPTFPEMILAIYKFGIWTVGIAGLFMLTIGGFWYMTSAGNNATAETAKKIIWDALLGIVAALAAYLIMYVINPDLTRINIKFVSVSVAPGAGTGTGGAGREGGAGGGACTVMTSGPCSVDNLKGAFSGDAEEMSKICNRESGGNTALTSGTDLCGDGNSFSIGLFQINMMTSAGSIGCDGGTIFEGNGSRSSSYNCLDHKTNSSGVTYCAHRDCKVKAGQESTYANCKAKLMDGTVNIQAAKALYSNGGLSHWSTSASRCQLN